MKKELKFTKTEKDEKISQIVDQAFTKLSCRMDGVAMYDELKNAILEAYKLGKLKRKKVKDRQVIELVPLGVSSIN